MSSKSSPSPSKGEKLSWDEMFEKLKQYQETHGDINMTDPTEFIHNKKLGRWVFNQRIYYKHYKNGNRSKRVCRGMCRERIEKCKSIGFELRSVDDIIKKKKDDTWQCMYEKLKEFKNEFGSMALKMLEEKEVDVVLKDWVDVQRNEYKEYKKQLKCNGASLKKVGKDDDADITSNCSTTMSLKSTSAMTANQFDALNEISFEGLIGEDDEQDGNEEGDDCDDNDESNNNINFHKESPQWEAQFGRLLKYKLLHGHVNVPRRYSSDPKLGTWVDCQRTGYKNFKLSNRRNTNGMNHNRIKRLEEIGFLWSMRGVVGEKKCKEDEGVEVFAVKMISKLEKKPSPPDADMSNSEAQVEDESTTGDKSIAEIILRKYGLYKGPINYRSFKSLGHYYYLKNNRLLNK